MSPRPWEWGVSVRGSPTDLQRGVGRGGQCGAGPAAVLRGLAVPLPYHHPLTALRAVGPRRPLTPGTVHCRQREK